MLSISSLIQHIRMKFFSSLFFWNTFIQSWIVFLSAYLNVFNELHSYKYCGQMAWGNAALEKALQDSLIDSEAHKYPAVGLEIA